MLDVFYHRSGGASIDVYICMPFCGENLDTIVKSNSLSDDHVSWFGYQILRGLKFLHSAGIIHRDLNPANLSTNAQCDLQVLYSYQLQAASDRHREDNVFQDRVLQLGSRGKA